MATQIVSKQLFKALERVQFGQLSLTTPDGQTRVFAGREPGVQAAATIHEWRVVANLAARGDIGFMDDYRAGRWDTPNLEDLLTFAMANEDALSGMIFGGWLGQLAGMVAHRLRPNSMRGSRRNIHAHYDLGNAFYELWLDAGMTYSAAVYGPKADTLPAAQDAKYDRILERLGASSGSLLEIGCGWGGFAERAITKGDYAVKGLTLSTEQQAYARERLGKSADIALEDYRRQTSRFDSIVSIEMFEAVGEKYWPVYFNRLNGLLHKGGRAVIQTITIDDHRFAKYRRSSDCIRSFIFPGGMLPSPARFGQEAEKAGLRTNDRFFFGRDYARTLSEWLENFDRAKAAVLGLGFDENFVRAWRFYLAACIAGFRTGRTNVMQVELQHA